MEIEEIKVTDRLKMRKLDELGAIEIMKNRETKKYNIPLSIDTMNKIKTIAALKGKNFKDLVNEILSQYAEKFSILVEEKQNKED